MGKLSAVAVKMRGGIHPKHLVSVDKPWYLEYVGKDDAILDIGCGTGVYMLRAAQRCRKISGFDNDQDMVIRAKRVLRHEGNAEVCCHDAELGIPWKDGQFDKVFLFNVLEHLKLRDWCLRECCRVLKPKGMLLLSVPNANTSPKRAREFFGFDGVADSDHEIEYGSLNEVCGELNRNGFSVVYSEPIVIDTLWAGLIDLIGGFNLKLYERLARWKRRKVFDNPQETTGWRIVCRKK